MTSSDTITHKKLIFTRVAQIEDTNIQRALQFYQFSITHGFDKRYSNIAQLVTTYCYFKY